jgi:hypothetical protein
MDCIRITHTRICVHDACAAERLIKGELRAQLTCKLSAPSPTLPRPSHRSSGPARTHTPARTRAAPHSPLAYGISAGVRLYKQASFARSELNRLRGRGCVASAKVNRTRRFAARQMVGARRTRGRARACECARFESGTRPRSGGSPRFNWARGWR